MNTKLWNFNELNFFVKFDSEENKDIYLFYFRLFSNIRIMQSICV